MFPLRTTIILVIVLLNYEFCFCGCSRAEYKIHKQCCPMCAPGNHVLWHCTDDSSTTCVPCPEFTFIDESNGFTKCFPCAVCNARQGLRMTKACTRSSNTVCGPLEGFYCIDKNKGSCAFAVKHTECSPGKYIKQAGTYFTDIVCGDCIGETYSNGSFSSCLAHTKCENLGLTEVNPGTNSSDAKCGNSSAVLIIIIISISGLVILLVIVCVVAYVWKKKKSSPGIQETARSFPEQASLTGQVDREKYDHYSFRKKTDPSPLPDDSIHYVKPEGLSFKRPTVFQT